MREVLSHTIRHGPCIGHEERKKDCFFILPSSFLPFLKLLSHSDCPSSARALTCQRCSTACNLQGHKQKDSRGCILIFTQTSLVTLCFVAWVSYGLQKPINADTAPLHGIHYSSPRMNTVLSQFLRATNWKARNLSDGVEQRIMGLPQSVKCVVF